MPGSSASRVDPGFAFQSPMFFLRNPPKTILTPCIGICTLAPDGYCVGCHRTGDEVARWSQLDDAERARIMDEVLPAREARRAATP